MLKIFSYNVNGIRSAINKGFIEWLIKTDPDIICLQETKATENDIDKNIITQLGYHIYWFSAQKKGYSGVAIFSKIKPIHVVMGNSYEQSDNEGRVLQLYFDNFILVNTYFPSGSSGEERQAYKMQFLSEYSVFVNLLKQKHKHIIIVGDYNICHQSIDIHDPIGNKNSSGFLPEEREWMTQFFNLGFVDTFRHVNPNPHHYSWWSYRANARANNKGWRIDYITVTNELQLQIKQAYILGDIMFSDHAPIGLEINL